MKLKMKVADQKRRKATYIMEKFYKELALWSRVLLGKLMISLVNKFPYFLKPEVLLVFLQKPAM
jgi:hypothetical protein